MITEPQQAAESSEPQVLRLRLRSAKTEVKIQEEENEKEGETKKPSVRWTQDTVNNESLGRKSSKSK